MGYRSRGCRVDPLPTSTCKRIAVYRRIRSRLRPARPHERWYAPGPGLEWNDAPPIPTSRIWEKRSPPPNLNPRALRTPERYRRWLETPPPTFIAVAGPGEHDPNIARSCSGVRYTLPRCSRELAPKVPIPWDRYPAPRTRVQVPGEYVPGPGVRRVSGEFPGPAPPSRTSHRVEVPNDALPRCAVGSEIVEDAFDAEAPAGTVSVPPASEGLDETSGHRSARSKATTGAFGRTERDCRPTAELPAARSCAPGPTVEYARGGTVYRAPRPNAGAFARSDNAWEPTDESAS